MRSLLTILSRPLNFALLIGVLTGTMVHFVGKWSLAPAQHILGQELIILSKDIAQAFLLSERTGNRNRNRVLLDRALNAAAAHPHVVSAKCVAADGRILGFAYKREGMESVASNNITYPVIGVRGEPLAVVTLALDGNVRAAVTPFLNRVRWYSFFGFLLGFSVCIVLLRRRNSFLPALMNAIKKVSQGQMDAELPVPTEGDYVDLSLAFNRMLEGLQERDRMRHSLGRIMDPKIAEILIKENPRVGGLRREATIMFCDIRNYTSICEQLTPDQLQEFLNEYWKETVEIIMEQEGTIDKFHGDGVCVVFGAPNLHPDDPLRAVRTAFRLVENVEKMNKRREAQRKTPIQIGIGIHNGEVIAGHIGSERRMDYTVVGDVVNVAARIEELNKKFGTKILISDAVYEQVEDYVRVKTITLAHLRGHKRPILIHTVREFLEVGGKSSVEPDSQAKAA